MSPRDFDPGPLADVQHRAEGGRSTLVFVRRLGHPPADVWGVLTEEDRLHRWAPFQPDRDLATPGPVLLRMTDGHATQEFPGNVRRAVAPKLLEYSWGEDLLRWELEPHGAGTRLTLHHTVAGLSWVPRVAAGWHLCLLVAERLLDGVPIGPIVGAAAKDYGWEKLHDAYAATLGIQGEGWPDDLFADP